jgi:HEAT repeat protein
MKPLLFTLVAFGIVGVAVGLLLSGDREAENLPDKGVAESVQAPVVKRAQDEQPPVEPEVGIDDLSATPVAIDEEMPVLLEELEQQQQQQQQQQKRLEVVNDEPELGSGEPTEFDENQEIVVGPKVGTEPALSGEPQQERFTRQTKVTVPENITTDEIQALVNELYERKDAGLAAAKLKIIGSKATPKLIAALETQQIYNTKFTAPDFLFVESFSPFQRICDIFEKTTPPEAIEPLTRYATHQDDHFRGYAAITLGNIATKECIGLMTKLLGDEDAGVRSSAMLGMQRALKTRPASDPFFLALVPAIKGTLDWNDKSILDEAPNLLLAIERERSIPLLLSEKYFTPSNEYFADILEAMNDAQIPVPHDKLLPLLTKLEPHSDEYPYKRQYAAAIVAYAHHPDAKTEAYLLTRKDSKNEDIAEAAIEGLGVFAGLIDPFAVVTAQLEEKGWSKLTKPQQHYYAVKVYDDEVRIDGHVQYFFSQFGSQYATALAGLAAIGAKNRAAMLRNAGQLFGPDGPPTDTNERNQQLDSFTLEQRQNLHAIDSEYYECKPSCTALLTLFALKHKEDFLAKK